jgi:hypothetical protein
MSIILLPSIPEMKSYSLGIFCSVPPLVFSPVVKHSSIRVLLAMVALFDFFSSLIDVSQDDSFSTW